MYLRSLLYCLVQSRCLKDYYIPPSLHHPSVKRGNVWVAVSLCSNLVAMEIFVNVCALMMIDDS